MGKQCHVEYDVEGRLKRAIVQLDEEEFQTRVDRFEASQLPWRIISCSMYVLRGDEMQVRAGVLLFLSSIIFPF